MKDIPIWFYIYLVPGILIWAGVALRNFAVTLKRPSESLRTVIFTFVITPIFVPFWPLWLFFSLLK